MLVDGCLMLVFLIDPLLQVLLLTLFLMRPFIPLSLLSSLLSLLINDGSQAIIDTTATVASLLQFTVHNDVAVYYF
jgi:hypothetical protein